MCEFSCLRSLRTTASTLSSSIKDQHTVEEHTVGILGDRNLKSPLSVSVL